MTDYEDMIVRVYLQASHDKGGGWEMAMRVMARRMLILEDRLLRSGVDFPTDAAMPRAAPPDGGG